ncbi:MAG: hypothetical protein HUU01_22940 [Saprospiraceae bacterium]|nr:hypothetical protein [Saprospiraceae bacterium]
MYEFKSRPVAAMADFMGTVVGIAEARSKIPAFTETGFETIPDPDWWVAGLLNPIKQHPNAGRIAYVLVWRNARKNHHYVPYPGHPSVNSFLAFLNDPGILLENDLPDMYRMPKKVKQEMQPIPVISDVTTQNKP